VGVLVGSLLLGMILLAVSSILGRTGRAIASVSAVALAVYSILLSGIGGVPRPPSSFWQVPRTWERMGPVGYPLSFGMALGLGFLTIVISLEFYVVVLAALGLGGIAAVAIPITMGLGRTAPYWLKLGDGEGWPPGVLRRWRGPVLALRLAVLASLVGAFVTTVLEGAIPFPFVMGG